MGLDVDVEAKAAIGVDFMVAQSPDTLPPQEKKLLYKLRFPCQGLGLEGTKTIIEIVKYKAGETF